MKKTQGIDDYLEAIYILHTEGHTVYGAKVADYLGVARPSVTKMMQRLVSLGYVEDKESRDIRLTSQGLKRAEVVIRRHRLIERWLTDVLGLDWAEAHEEANRLEHAISERVETRLARSLGYPTTCPHGNVIPGSGATISRAVPLSEMAVPATVRISRIFEQVEEDSGILRFLEQNGIVPEAQIQLVSLSPSDDKITVLVQGNEISIPMALAHRILVTKM